MTALNPVIGYDRATELAREAYATDKGVLELIREKKILTEGQIRELLDPAALTGLDPESYRWTQEANAWEMERWESERSEWQAY